VVVTYWWGRGRINKNTQKPCYDEDEPITKQPITYDKMIDRWEKTCKKANCNYLAIEYNEFTVPGGYQLAINAKPLFIKRALELCEGRAVVYIDGDMDVLQYPHIFDMNDYDFMARHWNLDSRNSKHYERNTCMDITVFETSGGIMYFNNTQNSKRLLSNWIYHTFYKINEGKADDRILSLLLLNHRYMFNLRMFMLPVEYIWLTDRYNKYLGYDKKKVVIEHAECLTPEEMATEQGASDNREPNIYTNLVSDAIQCSKYGGYFWEYIIFENTKQLGAVKPYLDYLKNSFIEDVFEEDTKHPYEFVEFNDKYGSNVFDKDVSLQTIFEANRIISNKLKKLFKTNMSRLVYVRHQTFDAPDEFYYIASDADGNSVVYTKYANSAIIALLDMGYEVIYLSTNKSIEYVGQIFIEKQKNSELELIVASNEGYDMDEVHFNRDSPIYLKKGRILMHLLNIINPEQDFLETLERMVKKSYFFIVCIRIGLFRTNTKKKESILGQVPTPRLVNGSFRASPKGSKGSKDSRDSRDSRDSKGSLKGSKGSKDSSTHSKGSKGSKGSKDNYSPDSGEIKLLQTMFKRMTTVHRRTHNKDL
jgi:hypothetical protein